MIRTISKRILSFAIVGGASHFVAGSLILLSTPQAQAYIPSSRTIAIRLAKNNGKGYYVVEQDVQFRSSNSDPINLREKWIIANGETMRLTVSSPKSSSEKYFYEAIYRDGKKTSPDLKNSTTIRSTAMPSEFIEGFNHARSSKGFLDALIRANIVPAKFIRDRQRFVTDPGSKTERYQPELMVRLGRTGGVVNYVFGEPTPVDAPKLKPGVWIEQDAFLLRRIRFPSEAEASLAMHTTYSGNLNLARERTVTWGDHSALIRVVSVKTLDQGSAENLLSPGSLNAASSGRAPLLPDQQSVREFYSRFR